MTDQPKDTGPSTLSVVVGLAFTDADGVAFDQAARVAKRVPRSELHLVHVFGEQPSVARSRELVDHLRLYVNEKAAAAGGFQAMTVGIHLRAGKPVREIVQLAADLRADLIVIGSHKGPHMKSWLVGLTAEQLLAAAPCPVLVAPPKLKATPPQEPAIEPPCPDCLRARATSGGAEWWCERHAHHAKQAHTFSYQRELPFASHDSEVIPTGITFGNEVAGGVAANEPSRAEETIMTKKNDKEADGAKKRVERELEGGAAGAVAGAAMGAVAGPPGAIAGAVVGAIAGAVAGRATEETDESRAAEDEKLDGEIGVSGGELGAPNLKHPPAKVGAYSAGSAGVSTSSGEEEPAEGPFQPPE